MVDSSGGVICKCSMGNTKILDGLFNNVDCCCCCSTGMLTLLVVIKFVSLVITMALSSLLLLLVRLRDETVPHVSTVASLGLSFGWYMDGFRLLPRFPLLWQDLPHRNGVWCASPNPSDGLGILMPYSKLSDESSLSSWLS